MITSGLIALFSTILWYFLGFLPEGSSLPTAIVNGFTMIFETAAGFNWLFPVTTLISILGWILAVEFGLLAWRSVNWIIRLIRGGG